MNGKKIWIDGRFYDWDEAKIHTPCIMVLAYLRVYVAIKQLRAMLFLD